jgi:hypothetical protein
MGTKTRLLIWTIFLTAATIFAVANKGWQETKWALIAFYILAIVVEIILYFKRTTK